MLKVMGENSVVNHHLSAPPAAGESCISDEMLWRTVFMNSFTS